MTPDITVAIPAYNVGRYLAATLDSLLAQTLTNWEAIVVDDGSTDATLEIARRYAESDPRIRVIEQENQGVSAARNRALDEARGQAFALLDGDDLWAPEKLERQLSCLDSQGADMVYTAYSHCDPDGRSMPFEYKGPVGAYSAREFFRLCYSRFFVLPSSVMLKTETLRRFGGFDATIRACEDWELWLRLALGGCGFYGMPEELLVYRCRPAGLSSQGLFEPTARMLPRYTGHPWLDDSERVKPYRLLFRNNFTALGGLRQTERGKEMFDLYFAHDSANFTARVMKVLRHLLPRYAFWLVSRFALIPLAWHLERLQEKSRKV